MCMCSFGDCVVYRWHITEGTSSNSSALLSWQGTCFWMMSMEVLHWVPSVNSFCSYLRSLELFFATSQNNRGEHLMDGKPPHLCRKSSSPPSMAVSRTSSPVRTRKLSLTSPLNSRIGALELTSSSASSSPTTTHSPAASPPPHVGKVPSDLNRGPSSPEQSPGSMEEQVDNPRVDLCNKLKRSIQRGIKQPPHPVLAFYLLLLQSSETL